jgi:hypothetical protein
LRDQTLALIGSGLIIFGSVVGTVGGIVNAFLLHDLAINLWFFSNLALLAWAIGFVKEWWNKKLSVEYIAGMYLIFTICNIYAISMR